MPGRVVVLGDGKAGFSAARVATVIGADVTILEVDFERMRFLDNTMSSTCWCVPTRRISRNCCRAWIW